MTVGYFGLIPVVALISASVQGVDPLLERPTHPLVPHMQLLIWQMPVSASLSIKTARSSLLQAGEASSTPPLSCPRGPSALQLMSTLRSQGS